FYFDYYNSMLINTLDGDGNYVLLGGEFPLEENEHFNKLPVNTQQSNIQVPTNVYNKDPNILNAVYNSEALNDVFISNFQRDPTLTWQYFGSSFGFFRIYPGIKWTPDTNGVVAFDCRNRNWYIQAATSPKDIIIMVDISGSMKGLKITIAKHTINTILDTLGENDFVNVIAYTDYVRYVESCFKGTLVQADLDNREVSKQASARVKGQGSMCNQAIMLITDGAMEDFESVFEEFNWPDHDQLYPFWIACNNKGYYTHISTLADVQENVMEYLHVLSRPMVINHDHDIIWTEAYMDTLFSTKAQSLLLMTSVAMPVFSKKKETLSHGILLGVVGTDIPLMEVMKLAPRYMLGPHGYAFLINNNGYILAHPDLRPLYKDGKKLKPKPNYNSVDLSEVEWEDKDVQLRTAMVRGETGSITLDIRASVDKGKRPIYLVNNYFFTDIDETPFSFGMVLTKGHGSLMFMGNVSVEEGLHDLTSPDLTIASEWTYCVTDIDPAHRKYTQFQAVIRYLLGKEPDLECDEMLLQQMLFDAVVTAPLEAYWNALMLSDRSGMETAFLGMRSGLMRTMRYAGTETRVAKTFLTPSDKDNLFTIDHFPLWYRLAVENTPGRFLYYPVNDKGTSANNCTTISPCICCSMSYESVLLSAVGVQMSLALLEKRFWATTKQVTVGRFFGEVDGSVMAALLKMGMFKKVSLFDYQAMCKNSHHHASGLGITHVSTTYLLLKRKWGSIHVATGEVTLSLFLAHKQRKVEALQPCDTAYPGFMYDESVREANSLIKCGRCQKMFVVQQVPDSNLVLIVTQADCDCSRQFGPISLQPKEIKYILQLMKSQKARRRPESCHSYHPKENAKECGGASSISLSLASASLVISLVLLSWM
uniref:Calcium voltage-gated channel auxiliary subunit alpha2delta 4 n=1 Tax=Nothobranchius furzeri TaxID=105023 RepID=A0A8C6MGD2_NOTFU